VDIDLNREIQKYYEEGQYLQIVQRLYKFDELPEGINVPFVIEAITNTFRTSSSPEEIFQADVVMARLEHQGYLNRSDLDAIFNAIGDVIVDAKGEIPFYLDGALMGSHDESAPENLIRLYARAKTREARAVLAGWIGSFYKEQGLLVLVDSLYSQKIIGNDYIRAILGKYSLLEDLDLKSDECDAIISTVLNYLETPGPRIENSDDEKKFEIDSINRTSAARILVVLNGYPKTSKESRARIQSKGDLIVTYHCADRMYDAFVEIPLSRYLSGNIR
jgi:hypothetical protein